MALNYRSLNNTVREAAIEELEHDVRSHLLYESKRLTTPGFDRWPRMLREALDTHDDQWLEQRLVETGSIAALELRNGRDVRVPVTAAETLAEGQFNLYYMRGVCVDAHNNGDDVVVVYRGKAVENPRPESEALIGRRLRAGDLLNDLRQSRGVESALGLSRPNSGLTVCRLGDYAP